MDGAAHLVRRRRQRLVGYFRRQIKHLEQALAGHPGSLHQIDDEAGHPKGLHHHVDVHEEGHQRPGGHLPGQHQMAAVAEDGEGADGGQAGHPGHHPRVDLGLAVEGVGVAQVGAVEAPDLVVLLGHGLNGADAGQVLLGQRRQIRKAVLHLQGGCAHLPGGALRVKENEG